jgi:hypothetical protein
MVDKSPSPPYTDKKVDMITVPGVKGDPYSFLSITVVAYSSTHTHTHEDGFLCKLPKH